MRPSFMYPWEKRTLFIGRLPGLAKVSYGAATVIVSLGSPIQMKTCRQQLTAQSFLIPPGAPVIINSKNEILAICHLDVMGIDYRMLLPSHTTATSSALVTCLKYEEDYFYSFKEMFLNPSDSASTYMCLNSLFTYCFCQCPELFQVDQRVSQIINYTKNNFNKNIPIQDLCTMVNTSVPRMLQVFKRHTGVPIRRFRLWHRMYESLLCIGDGASLTDAAVESGFFDSSHYTHTFYKLWGFKPSALFEKGIRTEIILPS